MSSDKQRRSGRFQLFQAAGIVSVAFAISRVIGFVREAIIGVYYGGNTVDVNAFTIANAIPETVFYIIAGGALGSAFIPTFAAYFAHDDEEGGWRLFSAIINLVTLLLTVICAIVAVLAPQVISLLYPNLVASEPDILPLAVRLLRIMLISTVIFGASGVVIGALQARQHFLLPALAPIVYNLGIILGTVLFQPDITGAAIGAVIGAAGHLLIQLPGLRLKSARYSWIVTVRDAGVQQVMRLMLPRLLGLAFGRINFLVTQFLGQMMVLGSIRALELGWRLMFMPISVIGQALGIASFPTLATHAAQGDYVAMRRILAATLRVTFFLGLPATLLMMGLARPLISTLLQYGAFDDESTQLVALTLFYYAVGLISLSAIEVLARAFFAMGDTWTPTIAGALQIIVMVGFASWFSQSLFPSLGLDALGGIALGASLANWLETIALTWLLRRRLNGIDGATIVDGLWRMFAATVLAAIALWLTLSMTEQFPALLQLLFGGVIAGGTYLLSAYILKVSELMQVSDMLLRRIRRR